MSLSDDFHRQARARVAAQYEADQKLIRDQVDKGVRVHHTGGKRSILSLGGKKYVVLVDSTGAVTPSGRYYYELTGEPEPNQRIDFRQVVDRRGDTEYIRDRQGAMRKLRTLRPDGNFKYTDLGRAFFKQKQVEYIIEAPAKIESSQHDPRDVYLPVERMDIGRIMQSAYLTERQREAKAKEYVLSHASMEDGRQVLHEDSGETWFYDSSRPWRMSSMETTPAEGVGDPDVRVVLHRPMAGLSTADEEDPEDLEGSEDEEDPTADPLPFRLAAAHLPYPDQICDEAWEVKPDKLCVIRQMAALLKLEQEDLINEFDRLLQRPWQHEGLTPNDVRAYCEEHSLSYFCVRGRRLMDIYKPVDPKRALAFVTYGGHAYFYKSARCVSEMRLWSEGGKEKVRTEAKSSAKPVSEWREWTGEVTPGTFYCSDLRHVRVELLRSGRNPKVRLRGLHDIGSLTHECTERNEGAKGACTVRELPEDAQDIQGWLDRIKELSGAAIEWHGERLPNLTQKVLKVLLKADRHYPSHEEKEAILKEQDKRCKLCNGIFDDDVEWDHVAPLRQLAAGQKEVFQAVCASCHMEKSQHEGGGMTLESRFSPRAHQAYVESPRLPPLSWSPNQAKEGELIEVDVNRCRRNAMYYSAHPWSIFCALDNVEKAQPGKLGHYSYVKGSRHSQKSRLSSLPYVGPGWYHAVAVQVMLHFGVVVWEDLEWSFSSTATLPADVFREPLDVMEKAWPEVYNERTGARERHRNAKESVNACIGLWLRNNSEVYSVRSSLDPADGIGAKITQVFEYEGGKIFDWVTVTKVLDLASMRPFWDQIMATEYARVAQIRHCITALGIPQKCIVHCKTDCLNVAGFAKKHKEKLMDLRHVRFKDLPGLRWRWDQAPPSQQFIDSLCRIPGVQDEDPVFKTGKGKPLAGNYREPAMEGHLIAPMEPWTDISPEAAADHVRNLGSLLVLGAPGTGKTYWAQQRVRELRTASKQVQVVSKCHAAVANFGLGAVTADHFCYKHVKHGSCSAHLGVVEELTQCNAYLWDDLAKLRLRGISMLLLGDWAQFEAIMDYISGCPVRQGALEHSDLVRELAGCFRMTLTENMRSDPPLFDYYCGLRVSTPLERPLAEALEEGRALHPVSGEMPDFTLVICHKKRMAINRELNLANKPRGAVLYKKEGAKGNEKDGDKHQQSMWLWPGMLCVGSGHKCKKNVFHTVKCVTDEGLVATFVTKNLEGTEDENEVKLSPEWAVKSLRPAWALCYAGIQGLTLKGRVLLEDTSHQHFGIKHLYIGSSRATAAQLLEIR